MLTELEHAELESKVHELNGEDGYPSHIVSDYRYRWRTKKICPAYYEECCAVVERRPVGKEYVVLVQFRDGMRTWGKRSWVKS